MRNDEDLGFVGLLLGGVVTLCVLGVIGLGISLTQSPHPSARLHAEAPEPIGEALARIYFEINSAELPDEAGGAIQSVKEKALAAPKLVVLVSGYHDPSGDPEQNTALARQRALATKLALMAAGIPGERIILRKPEVIPGDADLQEARRVDIRVQ